MTAVRVEALEALLVEKGVVDPRAVDEIIEHYESNVGPLNGAKVIARSSSTGGFSVSLPTQVAPNDSASSP